MGVGLSERRPRPSASPDQAELKPVGPSKQPTTDFGQLVKAEAPPTRAEHGVYFEHEVNR